MINKKSAYLTILGLLASPAMALAANVSVTDNTTLVLPSDGSTYNLLSTSSGFDTLTLNVSATNFVFTIPAGGSIILSTPTGQALANDAGATATCANGVTSLTVSGAVTVTVTPGSVTCI